MIEILIKPDVIIWTLPCSICDSKVGEMTAGLLLSGAPLAASAFSAGLWFLPALLAALAYYKYDEIDPESRPINRKRLFKEYDFIVGKL